MVKHVDVRNIYKLWQCSITNNHLRNIACRKQQERKVVNGMWRKYKMWHFAGLIQSQSSPEVIWLKTSTRRLKKRSYWVLPLNIIFSALIFADCYICRHCPSPEETHLMNSWTEISSLESKRSLNIKKKSTSKSISYPGELQMTWSPQKWTRPEQAMISMPRTHWFILWSL